MKTPKPKGRKPIYTLELAETVCARLAAGEMLRAICADPDMPSRFVVHSWITNDVDGFAGKYARAREVGFDELAEEALEIANTPVDGQRIEESEHGVKVVREDMLGHRRLQVDTRKWLLGKLASRKYGEKSALTVTGQDGGPVQIEAEARTERLERLMALARARKGDEG